MNATIQTQEVVYVAATKQVQYVFVNDPEMLNVGGGLAVVSY